MFFRSVSRAAVIVACAMSLALTAFATFAVDAAKAQSGSELVTMQDVGVAEFKQRLASDPVFRRLQEEDPKSFDLYASYIHERLAQRITGSVTMDQLLEQSYAVGVEMIAEKMQTAPAALVEEYARANYVLVERAFATNGSYCLSPSQMGLAATDEMDRDPELAFELAHVTARVVADPTTTPQPTLSPIELSELVSGPFMQASRAKAQELVRKHRPEGSHADDLAAVDSFFATGRPPSADMAWVQCAVGVAMNGAILELEPVEKRIATFRTISGMAQQ